MVVVCITVYRKTFDKARELRAWTRPTRVLAIGKEKIQTCEAPTNPIGDPSYVETGKKYKTTKRNMSRKGEVYGFP